MKHLINLLEKQIEYFEEMMNDTDYSKEANWQKRFDQGAIYGIKESIRKIKEYYKIK